jgi:hypothetical protein
MKITDHINFALDARVSSDKQDDISNQAQHENTETGLLKANPRALIHYRFADVHTGRNPRRPKATLGPGLQAVEAAQQRQPQ